jgi:hypothetical protein
MAYGQSLTYPKALWTLTTPVTTAASPVLSPWFNVDGSGQYYVIGVTAGGVSVLTAEWSFDGLVLDSDITATTIAIQLTAAVKDVLAPFMRLRWVQTSANATISKLTLRTR